MAQHAKKLDQTEKLEPNPNQMPGMGSASGSGTGGGSTTERPAAPRSATEKPSDAARMGSSEASTTGHESDKHKATPERTQYRPDANKPGNIKNTK